MRLYTYSGVYVHGSGKAKGLVAVAVVVYCGFQHRPGREGDSPEGEEEEAEEDWSRARTTPQVESLKFLQSVSTTLRKNQTCFFLLKEFSLNGHLENPLKPSTAESSEEKEQRQKTDAGTRGLSRQSYLLKLFRASSHRHRASSLGL